MKTIFCLSMALLVGSTLCTAQTTKKPALPRPTNKPVAMIEPNKHSEKLPHIALRLPVVSHIAQQQQPSHPVTIHESKNPAKVPKTVVKSAAKRVAPPATVEPALRPKAKAMPAESIASPSTEAAPETAVQGAKKTVKKYSRHTVSTPPRHAAQTTAAASLPAQDDNEQVAQNWLSDSYSVDEAGNRIAPPVAPVAVEEAPLARPVQTRRQVVEAAPAFYGAHYKFDSETINYGSISKGSNGKRKFYFRNDGTEPLVISSIIPGCSCVTAEMPKEPIQPGKTGFIEVEYDTTHEGEFVKDFVISSNSSGEDAVKIVYIKGTVH
jgi:Protein of unknown function (DUF1573)